MDSKGKIWASYWRRFRYSAKKRKYSGSFIDTCISYAKVLYDQEIPIIFDHRHFSRLVGYKITYIENAAHAQNRFYRSFLIDKKSGGKRQIDEPLPMLKDIQRWILENILDSIKPSKFAKAFYRGATIKSNAQFHRRQNIVLTVDIKDFFPSIKFHHVYQIFRRVGYTKSV